MQFLRNLYEILPTSIKMNNTQPIIDLTNSSPHINWPSSTTVIVLDDSIVHNDYPDRRDDVSLLINRSNTENLSAITINASIRVEETPKNRKTNRTRTKNNTRISTLATEQHHNRDRSRSPINFGECPICCEELGKNPLASTKCGHVYCIKCLEQSLKSNKRCPTCRLQLRGRTAYHPLYLSKNKN